MPPYAPSQGQSPYPPPGAPYDPSQSRQPTTYTRISYPPPPPPSQTPPGRRGSCVGGLIGALLGLALVCILGLVILSFSGAGKAVASRLRGQAATQAVDTLTFPTSTPPADFSLPAETPTPWPTATSAPEEPTATLNADQQAYLAKLLSPGCKSALDTLGTDSNTITQNPLILLDDTFRSGFTQALSDMKTNCGSLDAASPLPGKVGEVSQAITQANNEFDQANQLWTEAVKTHSPSLAFEAAQHIGAAAQYLGQAISELKAIAP